MKFSILVAAALLVQPGFRLPLSPAETLLEPAIIQAINEQSTGRGGSDAVAGSDPAAGDIFLTCAVERCTDARFALQKISALVKTNTLPQPARGIRVVSAVDPAAAGRARAAIHLAQTTERPVHILRGLWSTASLADEVVELFAKHASSGIEVKPFEDLGQLPLDAFAVGTTTIVGNPSMSNQLAANIAAQSAYFLATLPNAGAEALLSHLVVGAHARLAEDGRRAVGQMGSQQRAGADVLIMFGQAIEREQRRMRSFERFMPAPIEPALRDRIADMERAITSVWTSIGITHSPFVPASERIRGRGGEDRRIPRRVGVGRPAAVEPPAAFLKFPNPGVITYELGNFIDGTRSISDIRDAVSAEFGPLPLPSVVDYFERLATSGAITLK